jgi:GrpB-like predicted nucleotidyltransferase (UPF0157 family)
MPIEDPIVVVPFDSGWAFEFQAMGARLRGALGGSARRIDHIGSTAVPGLDAKPVIDIQISVGSLVPEEPFRAPLVSLGFLYQAENSDRAKRFFREPPGTRRVHVHVRAAGSFDEQLNLLFRDFLRTHADARSEYAAGKRALAARFRGDRDGYVQAKEPLVWSLLQRAHDWLEASGWAPGPSDV